MSRSDSSERKKVLTAYIIDRIEREGAGNRGYKSSLADRIGFSRPAITQLVAGIRQAGPDLCEALAAEWGMTYDQLKNEATRFWARRNPPTPNRDATLAFMAEEIDPEVVDYVKAIELPAGDLSRENWLEIIKAKQTEVRILRGQSSPVRGKFKAPKEKTPRS